MLAPVFTHTMATLEDPLFGNGEAHHAPQLDRPSSKSEASVDGSGEVAPRLHAKTFLAVLAVCLIYFAQLVSLVGAGVVSSARPLFSQLLRYSELSAASTNHRRPLQRYQQGSLVPRFPRHLHCRPRAYSIPGGRLLGPEMVPRHPVSNRRCRLRRPVSRTIHQHGHRRLLPHRRRLRHTTPPPRRPLRNPP
jgi:hypothetical protein